MAARKDRYSDEGMRMEGRWCVDSTGRKGRCVQMKRD